MQEQILWIQGLTVAYCEILQEFGITEFVIVKEDGCPPRLLLGKQSDSEITAALIKLNAGEPADTKH